MACCCCSDKLHPKFTPKTWYKHPNGGRYCIILKDGRLHKIKVRVFEKKPVSAGGGYYYNKVVWDYNATQGERSDKIVTLLAELGVQNV